MYKSKLSLRVSKIRRYSIVSDLTWLSITMFMAGKLMASLYFTITYIYTSELFPTYTRNSMHALCSSLGRIGSIVAPQAPLLVRNLILSVTS